MEHNKTSYQPPKVSVVDLVAESLICFSERLITEDSDFINGDWEEE